MENHVYVFYKEVHKQIDGGPIGLRVTGSIAKIVMIWFDKKLLVSLKVLKIQVLMYKRYVDDANLVLRALTKGLQFDGTKLVLDPINQSDPPDVQTARVITQIADSILPDVIKMEFDTPSLHPNERLPILDLEVWVENNQIYHSFYKKSMASQSVIR